jgi:hypothetical protein
MEKIWTVHVTNGSRWIFYSAVNSITPQVVLNLGFETSAWKISLRQLSFTGMVLIMPFPIM